MFRAFRWIVPIAAGLPLLATVSCAPPPSVELTRTQAASLVAARLAEPVKTTYLNPMKLGHCIDLTRYFVYCQTADLVDLQWQNQNPPCGEFSVGLTEKGHRYFRDLEWTGLPKPVYTTKGWTVTLEMPITADLVRIDRIEHQGAHRRKIHYTYRQNYDPVLTGCTRDSQPGPQKGEVIASLVGGEWLLE